MVVQDWSSSSSHETPETGVLEGAQSIVITTKLHTHSARRKVLNQYVGRERIGRGQHGEVFLSEDSDANNRQVAIKIVRRSSPKDKIKLLRKTYQQQEASSRSKRPRLSSTENSIRKEIAVMKRCRHPNLATLYEVIDDPKQDKIFLIMEYLAGGPVEWSSAEHRPLLTLAQTRRIVRDVILGLEFMHSKDILHRDIKPSNIVYTADRRTVKLIDFGISHIIYPSPDKKRAQQDKPEDPDADLFSRSDLLKRIGTPSFLAPEVVWFSDALDLSSCISYDIPNFETRDYPTTSVLNERHSSAPNIATSSFAMPKTRPPVTRAIDVWSLGVTIYCFLFGRTPFSGVSTSGDNNENVRHQEFVLYHHICTTDWSVDDTMGADCIPTGGRYPADKKTDGYLAIRLLDGLLQKDPRDRLSLSQAKKNSFVLRDVADAKRWVQVTSPEPGSRYGWAKNAWRSLFKSIRENPS